MTKSFSDLLRETRALVAAGRLDQATAAIGEALTRRRDDGAAPRPGEGSADAGGSRPSAAGIGERLKTLLPGVAGRPRFPAPAPGRPQSPAPGRSPTPRPGDSPPAGSGRPDGSRFEMRVHSGPHGSRRYKLYVPARPAEGPRPLIVMLHGCTQDPDDFARGTRMNVLAEEAGALVAYPEQPASANAHKCWNWFEPAHQRSGAGEPAILAGIVEDMARAFAVDRSRVFAAGLSAGGAMAAVLGATDPALFAAVGVHSGLPHGAAADVMSALSVMRSGRAASGHPVATRLIVFHGDRDRTVHPANGDALAGLVTDTPGTEITRGERGGRAYTRLRRPKAGAAPEVESWSVEGLGHAWSGGDASGSYADPAGPDASREMLRFFLSPASPPA